MEQFEIGDLVVLTAGSMRMAVEAVEGDKVHVVWCHEGVIGRDAFAPRLLKRWEVREHDSRPPREEGGGRPRHGEDRPRGPKPFGKPFAGPASPGVAKPRPKTGWDGKPREKKFFRKD